MRRNIVLAIVAVCILALSIGAYIYGSFRRDEPAASWQPPQSSAEEGLPADLEYTSVLVQAGSRSFELQLADTGQKQQIGLGKRETIGGDGMLFAYSKPQKLCFWMKDMHFSIDMLWLDADKRVVKLEPDVSPNTYPRQTYCQDEARYVVELAAGQAMTAGVAVGSTLEFGL